MPDHLYVAIQKEFGSDLNIIDVFDAWGKWASQPGYPVLNVRIASDRKHVDIVQKQFLRNNPHHQMDTLWTVPFSYASNKENTDFSSTKHSTNFSVQSIQIELNGPIDWIILNVQQTGKE